VEKRGCAVPLVVIPAKAGIQVLNNQRAQRCFEPLVVLLLLTLAPLGARLTPLCIWEEARRGARRTRAPLREAGSRLAKRGAQTHRVTGSLRAERGSLSFGYFSLAKQRKVTRPAGRDRLSKKRREPQK
jgi:hypothetical protein